VAEGGQITYTATLTNAAGSPVTVTLSNGAVITIDAGKTTGTVTVAAPADDVYKDAGTVQATISTATGGNFESLVTKHCSGRNQRHRHHRHHDGETDGDRHCG
jgi:surface adhesion protein